jgi:protein arginine kinase activator
MRPIMKCQKCAKPATFHITDIERGGKPHEFHLCDEHAREHLDPTKEATESLALGKLAEGLIKSTGGAGAGTREASAADKQSCPLCNLTFLDFRSTGRLGCPHDYEVFREELLPLLENIHDETRHSGKVPRRAPRGSQKQTMLIQKRNELKRAVAEENYEAAARLRDEIKKLEQD